MKFLTDNSHIPFSEQTFKVELTGLELAMIRLFTGSVIGNPESSIRKISNDMYNSVVDRVNSSYMTKENIDLCNISLEQFTKEINELNK